MSAEVQSSAQNVTVCEQNVLGSLLIDPNAWDRVADVLRPEDFYRPDHQLIFQAIQTLHATGRPHDVVTVFAHLEIGNESEAAGGFAYIGSLARDTCSPENVQTYARILKSEANRRELARELARSAEAMMAVDAVPAEIVARAQTELARLSPSKSESQETDGPRVQVVRVADVEARELEPLWPGIVWVGKPTLLVGDPGLSKSTMVCDVVARVTRHRDWPCAVPATIQGDVLMLSAEDDVADTLRPRLEAAGADLTRVHFLSSVITGPPRSSVRHSWPSLVEHIDALRAWLSQHPNVRLLVVDPLAAYLTGVDSHKQSDVRAVLGALSQMAAQFRVAVLAVMHLNKGQGGNALYRISGSLAFVAAARAVYVIARDPQDRDHRLMLHLKNNLSRDERGFRYVVRTADNEAPYVEWNTERVDQTAEEVMAVAAEETPRERALSERDQAVSDWLTGLLKNGPVEAASIWRKAEQDGHPERCVERVAKRLGVQKRIMGFAGRWHWELTAKPNGVYQ